MIQGVLFDMDGLMFDTERIGYEGWKYAGKKLGIHMKDELIASFRGTGEKEKRRHFKEAFGSESIYIFKRNRSCITSDRKNRD